MTPILSIPLAKSYLHARYRVTVKKRTITFSAFKQSIALKKINARYHVKNAALISAYNPYSQISNALMNKDKQEALINEVLESWQFLPGGGYDINNLWSDEPSLYILGIPIKRALSLGRKYQQHAIITINEQGETTLLACKPRNQSILTYAMASLSLP